MRYFYFFLVGLVTLAALYSLTGISVLKWSTYQVQNPKAEFLILNSGTNDITIVDFTNYRCRFCKQMHSTIKEARALQKNIRYVPRPILFGIAEDAKPEDIQRPAMLEKLVIAAGLQGKFEEMHNSFMEYPKDVIPQDFIEETANLYGIDYAKMVEDSEGDEVQNILKDNMKDMMGYRIPSLPSYIINKNIYVVGDTMPSLTEFLTMIENEKK